MSATIPISGPLVPGASDFATTDDAYVAGGFRVVADTTARDAIPSSRLKVGMQVRTISPAQTWRLVSVGPPLSWTETDTPTVLDWAGRQAAGVVQTRNTHTAAGSYVAVTSGTHNYVLNADTQCVTTGNQWRVQRDLAEVDQVQFYFGPKTNIYDFTINVWRRAASYHWNLVDSTGNLIDLITANSINTITLPRKLRGVRNGDHVGWGLAATAYPVTSLLYTTVGGAGNRSVVTVQASRREAEYNMWNVWSGSVTNQNDLGVAIRLIGTAPDIVAIGDSLTAGSPNTRSALEAAKNETGTGGLNYFDAYTPAYQYTHFIPGWVCQNMGISSQTSADVLARFTADVIDLKPRVAIIGVGTNDIPALVSQSTWLGRMTTMIDACLTNRIFPVVLGIWPRQDWCTPSTYWASQARRAWNTALQSLIGTTYYRRALYVNMDSTIGANYAPGDAGNLDGLQPAYNADSIHLTVAGYTAVGGAITTALNTIWRPS